MHCSACSSAVEAALAALPGVSSASVALLAQSAEVGPPPPLFGAPCGSCVRLPLFLACPQARSFLPMAATHLAEGSICIRDDLSTVGEAHCASAGGLRRQ